MSAALTGLEKPKQNNGYREVADGNANGGFWRERQSATTEMKDEGDKHRAVKGAGGMRSLQGGRRG